MKKSLKVWFFGFVIFLSVLLIGSTAFAKSSVTPVRTSDIIQQDINQSADRKLKEADRKLKESINNLAKKQQAEKARQAQEARNREVWITINTECMWGVGCGLSVYDSLGIRKGRAEGERTSVMLFLQDIILGASMFIGTVAAVAFILSGVYYIFSASDASYKKKAQEWMKYAVYGLVLVTLAIVIVRITQFIARGGS